VYSLSNKEQTINFGLRINLGRVIFRIEIKCYYSAVDYGLFFLLSPAISPVTIKFDGKISLVILFMRMVKRSSVLLIKPWLQLK